jgi:hypothetical protein
MKMIFIGDATAFEKDFGIEPLYNEKTEEEKARIAAALSTAVVFRTLQTRNANLFKVSWSR